MSKLSGVLTPCVNQPATILIFGSGFQMRMVWAGVIGRNDDQGESMFSSPRISRFNASSFQVIKDAMLQSEDLPLSEFIDDDQWQAVFNQHDIDFGRDEDSVYTPAVTLWGLISQVFFKGENRSCKAAVLRIASLWAMLGKTICNTNTGAYCRARLKISFEAVRDIARQLALSTEAAFDRRYTRCRLLPLYVPDCHCLQIQKR